MGPTPDSCQFCMPRLIIHTSKTSSSTRIRDKFLLCRAAKDSKSVQFREQEAEAKPCCSLQLPEGRKWRMRRWFLCDRMHGNGSKLYHGRFRLVIRKHFIKRVVKHWNRLPKEMVDAQTLCIRGIWTVYLAKYFKFWSALNWSDSRTRLWL